MAGNSLSLVWDLIARDGASPVFERVSASADKAAASTEAAAVKTGASLSKMAQVGAVAGVAFAAVAVKMASDFQRQMLLVQTQAGASADEVRKMTPAILSLSGKVAQAPEALATSLYHVESTGLRGAAALEAVKVAAEGARVGHADLEETTNALTATIASGMVPATESFSEAMGQLNTIVGSGDMKLSDLNDALGTGFMVQVKQYGATLNDVGAALADFGDNNIRGADAATMLRMAVQAIAKPGKDAESALGRIGLTVGKLQSDEQTGGLNKALTDLHSHLVNSGIDVSQWGALMTDAFTKKAGGGIITLIGTYDRFEQKYKEVQAGAASFGDAWAATQKSAAFQAAALKDNIEAMTISIGNHLLPIVTSVTTWINQNAVPALQHLGGAALDVAHWFGELPAPIKDVALALGGLALANAIGLVGALSGAAARLGGAFVQVGTAVAAPLVAVAGLSDEMKVQQALMQMEAEDAQLAAAGLDGLAGAFSAATVESTRLTGSLTSVQLMMAGLDAELAATVGEEEAAAASTGALSASMTVLAQRGLAAAESGMSRLLSMMGGPWGAALIGATAYVMLVESAIGKATDQQNKWTDALKTGGDAAAKATTEMALYQAKVDQVEGRVGSFGMAVAGALAPVDAMIPSVKKATEAYQAWYNSLGTSDKIQQDSTVSQKALNDAVAKYGANSSQAKAAAAAYVGEQTKVKTVSDGVTQAIAAAGGAAQDAAPKLEFAGSAAGMSADQVKAANKEWETWIKNLSGIAAAFTDPLTTYEGLLSDKQAAEQKAAQATADATKSGKDSWQDYVKNVGVSISEFAGKLEDEIKNEQDWQNNLVIIAQRGGDQVAQQFANMGQKGADATAAMAHATNSDFTRMATDMITQAGLAGDGSIATLDTKMKVMAEVGREGGSATAQAVSDALHVGINDVAAIAAQYGVTLATGLEPILQGLGKPPIIVPGYVTRPGLIGRNADGGFIAGPGTGRSDSILSFLSNGEFVINADATAKHRPLLEAINGAPRFAGGGFASAGDVPHPYSTAPFQYPLSTPSDATMSLEYGDVTSWLQSNLFSGSGTGAGSPLMRLLGASIAASMGYGGQFNAIDYIFSRESGWNPLAQNPTSTAFGIPQFLNSTWAAYGGKTTDAAQQIRDGISYMRDRYGSPNGAAAFWAAHHWYKDGTNFVPSDQLAFLHKGEAVIPANRNQGAPYASSGPAVFHLYDADRKLIGTMEGIAVGAVLEHADVGFNRGQYNG